MVKTAKIVIGRDESLANEEDFDAFVTYVCDRIDEECGFSVHVETHGPRDVQNTVVTASDDEAEDTVKGALYRLWEAFCADDSAWPKGASIEEIGVLRDNAYDARDATYAGADIDATSFARANDAASASADALAAAYQHVPRTTKP
jgi:hypothetical protein